MHRVAFLVYIPLFLFLIVASPHRLAVVAYAIGVLAMLGVSSVYHWSRITPTLHRRLKRVDHSTILLAIAGSTTGVAAFVPDGAPLIICVWIAAGIGIAIRMLWIDAPPPLVAIVYVVVGWMPIVFWPTLSDGLSSTELALVVAGVTVHYIAVLSLVLAA